MSIVDRTEENRARLMETANGEYRALQEQIATERRQFMLLLAAILLSQGGEMRIPERCLAAVDHTATIHRWKDRDQCQIVYRYVEPQRQEVAK